MLVIYLLLSVAIIVFTTAKLKIHPFLVLLFVALAYGFLAGMPVDEIIASVNQGFGGTLGGIGLIIILGVIIGAFLETSGGAYAIAQKVLNWVGKRNVPSAMGVMGYVISIPVFADSGFMLLSALNRSLCKKAGITLAGSAIALGLGLTVSHNLVPPTPGPIAAAGILEADLGLVLMIGIPVSIVSLIVSILFATKIVAKVYIDPAPEISEQEIDAAMAKAPSAFKSMLPIFVPIVLIVGKSLAKALGLEPSALHSFIFFFGEPFIALFIGVGLAVLLPTKFEWQSLSSDGLIAKALSNAASIIMITGAGGIFGKVLFNSGIADVLGETLSQWNIGLLLPFLLAASLKTAQGSSTVALITTASILAPLMASLGFDTASQKALVVLAIGAGSAVMSHANDSFFWVVTQMSGMDVKTGYRTHSLGTLLIGLSAISTLFAISLFV
jgi:GntP family gluconate:H+ symporter